MNASAVRISSYLLLLVQGTFGAMGPFWHVHAHRRGGEACHHHHPTASWFGDSICESDRHRSEDALHQHGAISAKPAEDGAAIFQASDQGFEDDPSTCSLCSHYRHAALQAVMPLALVPVRLTAPPEPTWEAPDQTFWSRFDARGPPLI